RAPPTTVHGRTSQPIAGRHAEVHGARGGRGGARRGGAVLDRVGEERFLGGHQVPKVRLHRGDVRLRLGVGELRDRDGGQNADDHHHDQELNECKTLAVHHEIAPVGVFQLTADTLLVEVPRGVGGKHYAPDPLSSQETYSQRLVYGRSGAALGLRVVPFAILLADRYAWLPLDLGTRETRGACHKGVCCLRVTVCARHLSLVAVIARASSVTQPLEAGEQGVGSLRLPGGERRDGPRHVDRRIAIVQRCRD